MGVKGLWELVSPTGEMVCLAAHSGEAVAVDLAGWLVDTQSLQLGHHVTRPHLRNLFFRTVACLQVGVVPVMVLEGEAPSLKWNTINTRNQRNFGPSRGGCGGGGGSGKRSHFNAVLKKCTELFDLLGVPWVKAVGEAEATCAALNYHKVVQGVITQDSDVFLYGGSTVFRNFTANQKKVTAEKFRMELIEERLQVSRGGMMLLAVVLGCDYLPGGVHGVGKDTALRFLRAAYTAGDRDPSQRLEQWASEHHPSCKPSELASTKWKRGSDDVLEEGLKKRLAATQGFPFTELLEEFRHKLPLPLKKVKWTQPDFEGLVGWCMRMLEWECSYVVEKVAPVVTRWTVTQGAVPRPLQPVGVLKRCVRQGVVCLRLEWSVNASLPPDTPQRITTEEPLQLLQSSLPHLVKQFEELTLASKRGKKKSKSVKTKEAVSNKENINESTNTITQYFKPIKGRSEAVTQTKTLTITSNESDRKTKGAMGKEDKVRGKHNYKNIREVGIGHRHREDKYRGEEEEECGKKEKERRGKEEQLKGGDKNTREHTIKVLNQRSEDLYEEEEEEEDFECDERELSLIIDRMINMKMNAGDRQPQRITQDTAQRNEGSKCESGKKGASARDKERRTGQVKTQGNEMSPCKPSKRNAGNKERKPNITQDTDEENMTPPQHLSLYDRVSKRLSKKGYRHSKPSSYVKVELNSVSANNISDDDNWTNVAVSPIYKHSKPSSNDRGELDCLSTNIGTCDNDSLSDTVKNLNSTSDDIWTNVAVSPIYKHSKPSSYGRGELDYLFTNIGTCDNDSWSDTVKNLNSISDNDIWPVVDISPVYKHSKPSSHDREELDSLSTNTGTCDSDSCPDTVKNPSGKSKYESTVGTWTGRVREKSDEVSTGGVCSSVHDLEAKTQSNDLSIDIFEDSFPDNTAEESVTSSVTFPDNTTEENVASPDTLPGNTAEENVTLPDNTAEESVTSPDTFPDNTTEENVTSPDTFPGNTTEENVTSPDTLPGNTAEENVTSPDTLPGNTAEESVTLPETFPENTPKEMIKGVLGLTLASNFTVDNKTEMNDAELNPNTLDDLENTMKEDELSANTLAIMFEKSLSLDSPLSNSDTTKDTKGSEMGSVASQISTSDCINKTQVESVEPSHVQPKHEDWKRMLSRKIEITTAPLQDITNNHNDISHNINYPKAPITILGCRKGGLIEGKDAEANDVFKPPLRNAARKKCESKEKLDNAHLDLNGKDESMKDEEAGVNFVFSPPQKSSQEKSYEGEEKFDIARNMNEKKNRDAGVDSTFTPPPKSPEGKSCKRREKLDIALKKEGSVTDKNKKEEGISYKENLPVSQRSKSDSELQPDPLSPELTLTLAQRLRLKCTDKRYRKLLDDLR